MLLNDGTCAFTLAPTALPIADQITRDAALLDVDQDGDLDLLRTSKAEMQLLRGDGSGAFALDAAAFPAFAPGWATILEFGTGDLDGDGWVDVYAVGAVVGSSSEAVFLGGPAGFALAAQPATAKLSRAVALDDLDGDGDLDAFVGKEAYYDVLMFNQGGAAFTPAGMPTKISQTYAVATGDLDADGDADLVCGMQNPSYWVAPPIVMYLGDGLGGFVDVHLTHMPPLQLNVSEVLPFDADADGDLDLFLGTFQEEADRLLRNDGAAGFQAVQVLQPVGWFGTGEAVADDLDGDGDVDLALERAGLTLYLGNAGAFVEVTGGLDAPWIAYSDDSSDAKLLDVDGDQDLDVVTLSNDRPMRLYVNDGFGRYADASVGPPDDGPEPVDVEGVDADLDGDLELLVGHRPISSTLGPYLRLYTNQGGTSYAETPAALPPIVDPVDEIAVGDVDGDGISDLLLAQWALGSPYAAPNSLLRGDGVGGFVDASATLPPSAKISKVVALGDVDGDGDLDAYIGNRPATYGGPGGADQLLLNDGAGSFAPGALPADDTHDTENARMFDADADGDLDVAVSGWIDPTLFSGFAYTWANDGTGGFGAVQNGLGGGVLEPFDVDFDGDLDVAAGKILLLNDGSGHFIEDPGAIDADGPGFPSLVRAGDVDGDGEWDLFALYFDDQSRMFFGVKRQLDRVSIPQLGLPLVHVIHGPAGQPWFLGLSFGTAHLPLPGLGTLSIDPSQTLLIGAGLLDAQGERHVTIPAVTDPAFTGLVVYWQAIVGESPKLTNQERSELVDL